MRSTLLIAMIAAICLAAPGPAGAQGKGKAAEQGARERGPQGKGRAAQQARQARQAAPGQDQGQAKGKARGRGAPAPTEAGATRGGPPAHARGGRGSAGARSRRGSPAPPLEEFNRNLPEKAVRARAHRAGGAPGVRVERTDAEVRFLTEDGTTLFRLDRSTADDLGYWRAARVPAVPADRDRADARDRGGIFGPGDRYPDDRGRRGGSPSFCRSGAGHPVWGRDWCLDKGFGLGDGRTAWGVDRDLEDIILRPDPDQDVIGSGDLIDILGDVVFGRLAMQSLVLGADRPLQGRWLTHRDADGARDGARDGPRVLRVHSGGLPVAELVDYDRDDEVDTIVFNLGG